MTKPEPPHVRDRLAIALVRSARSDSPRAGAKGRALLRLDARAAGSPAVLGWCGSHAALLRHCLRLAASAALVAASMSWAMAGPAAAYDTPNASRCRAGAEWSSPASACGDGNGAALVGNGSGSSSGSSSG